MNALNITSLKVTVCAAAALLLTMAASYTFVDSNSVLRLAAAPAQMVASSGASHWAQAAKVAATGLLQ
jgi:hypothetical protein